MAITLRRTTAGQLVRALAIIGIGAGLVYLVQFAEFASVMFEVFSGINSTSEAAENQRGHMVDVRTESSGRWHDPEKTIVRVQRVHHWFWTTLVEIDSFGVQEHIQWKDDDTLEVTLGFGCLAHMTRPVQTVGSIHISYHFINGDKALSKGCPDQLNFRPVRLMYRIADPGPQPGKCGCGQVLTRRSRAAQVTGRDQT